MLLKAVSLFGYSIRLSITALVVLIPYAAGAGVRVASGAPPGFESLEAPRRTVVTLSYGGLLLGQFNAQFSLTTLAFDHPETILAAIPAINDEAKVGAVLASPLPVHSELRCTLKKNAGCGVLHPEIAGIIFDENRLAAELFINPAFLAVQDGEKYLPLPERKFSSVTRFDGAVNGTDEARPHYALTANSTFALGEGNLATQTSATDRGVRFDTVSANEERQGVSASAGLIRSIPTQLLGDRDIAGISVATSTRTRLDARKTEGNDIIVYLPRRAFVSIYREGRLYSSRSYDSGNQHIDTSELPDGAYNVTLKIQEIGGVMREETHFFAKSVHIPAADAPTYYAQAGVMRKALSQENTVPQVTTQPLLRVGTERRVADNVGVSVGALGISDRGAVELGTYLVQSGMEAYTAAMLSSRRDAGAQAGLIYIAPQWNASLDARKILSDSPTPGVYDSLFSALTQTTMSMSYLPTSEVTLTLRGTYTKSNVMAATASFGPEINWRLWQEGESLLSISAGAARVNQRNEGAAVVRFTYRLGEYGVTGEGGAGYGMASHGPFGSTRVWRDHVTPDEYLNVGAGIHDDRNRKTLSADGDWRGGMGSAQGGVQQSIGNGSALAYGGNFSFAAAQADERVHIGGFDNSASAVSIEVEGDSASELTIFVNGVAHGSVHGGETRVVYLSPYNMYQVHLAPAKPDMLALEGDERKIALYPGNVARLHWSVHRFNVVAARVVMASGTPLTNALLKESAASVTTDSQGRFQAELLQSASLTFLMPDNAGSCRVSLPEGIMPVNSVYLYRSPLICR